MEFLVDQFKFLGLNDREVRVFTALSTFGRMNMTKISSRAGLSRTTVDAIVRRLVEQGLVAQEKVSGHFEYAVRLHEVADRLDWLEQRLRPGVVDDPTTPSQPSPCKGEGAPPPARGGGARREEGVGGASLPLPDGMRSAGSTPQERGWEPLPDGMRSAGSTPQGRGWETLSETPTVPTDCHESMHALVERTFVSHGGERVTMLVAALIEGSKRLERFEHCLNSARSAHIKLEMLATTDVTKELSVYARELLALLTVYDLRLNFMPPSFCIEHTDMLAFRDVVLVIDHEHDLVEEVRSPRAVAVINHLLRVAREVGWGMDMKMWLEGIIASQKLAEPARGQVAG